MGKKYPEHILMEKHDFRVIEMCPRCHRSPLYRPQPEVVNCYSGGCVRGDDRGDLYVRVDAVRALVRDQNALDNLVAEVLPLYPWVEPGSVQPTNQP